MEQAKRYSRGIDQQPQYQGQYHVPFLYSTNGEIIHFLDTRSPLNLSREIAGFHTPGALAELLSRDYDAELARLADVPFSPILRPYQIEANQAVDQALRERRAQDAAHHGDRHRQDARDGQRGLPPHEVGRRSPRAVPGRPPRPGRPGRARVRVL